MTRLGAFLLAVFTGLMPATGNTQSHDLLRAFADCTGRYSAQTEHHWLLGDPASAQTAERRDTFAEMLDAISPADAAQQALAWRIDAKAAQAALLRRATFGTDALARRAAARRASQVLATCDLLLLGA